MSEWLAYYEIEPFGDERADFRSAISATAISNILLKANWKRPKALKVESFMPKFKERKTEPKSPKDLLAKAEIINAAFGGIDLRKKI